MNFGFLPYLIPLVTVGSCSALIWVGTRTHRSRLKQLKQKRKELEDTRKRGVELVHLEGELVSALGELSELIEQASSKGYDAPDLSDAVIMERIQELGDIEERSSNLRLRSTRLGVSSRPGGPSLPLGLWMEASENGPFDDAFLNLQYIKLLLYQFAEAEDAERRRKFAEELTKLLQGSVQTE